jgi:bifunctional UDP-N-acetylglucosamine pyrophosphorylase/glucosamine-1-phosphate N-acetyltransferase
MKLSIVILAAGQGKRMNSDLPKVLQPLAGRPLLQHVIDAARSLSPDAIHVVHGHGGEQVISAMSHESAGTKPVAWVLQPQQLGTGHAVGCAMAKVDAESLVLVLYGDVPLIDPATLRTLIDLAAGASSGKAALALLTVELPDPDRLRPHRPRREGPGAAHRRAEGCDEVSARDSRGQHGRARSASAAAVALARPAQQ